MMPVLSRQFVLALLIPRLLPYALIAEPWVCVIAAVRSGVVITSVLHTVQLHVVQEVWDALQLEDDGVISPSSDGSSEHVFLAISKAAVHGQVAPRTVKFLGSIQHVPVSILVDSGSSTSFISSKLASRLSGIIPLPKPTSVQVAGGGLLSCSTFLAQAIWFIGDLSFQSDLRVLPLAAYDIIVGMDWLERYSPMRVHWKQKWMEIPYEGQVVTLQGVVPDCPEEVLVQLSILTPEDVVPSAVHVLPAEIQLLLDQFAVLFEEPPASLRLEHVITRFRFFQGPDQ
jgi:hypothetical protein